MEPPTVRGISRRPDSKRVSACRKRGTRQEGRGRRLASIQRGRGTRSLGIRRSNPGRTIMRATSWLPALAAAGLFPALADDQVGEAAGDDSWTSVFPVEKGELKSSGRNPFFV